MPITLRINGVDTPYKSFKFSAGEVHVNVKEALKNLEPTDDFEVIARLHSSDDIMEMFLLLDAVNRFHSSFVRIDLTIPYLPYSRQDRVCTKGDPSSLGVFLLLLEKFVDESFHPVYLRVADLHSENVDILGFPQKDGLIELDWSDILDDSIRFFDEISFKGVEVVSPDKGAREKTINFTDYLYDCDVGSSKFYQGSKVRDPATGNLTGFDVDCKDFKGQDLIIMDDICDGGGTFLGLAKVLKERNAGKISLYVTHGIFSKGIDIFEGLIDTIYTTDSFDQSRFSDRPEDSKVKLKVIYKF